MSLKGIIKGIGSAFSVVKHDAQKVAPEIQRDIDSIMAAAHAKVADLKGQHSVQAINEEAEAAMQAVRETSAHHIALITAQRDAKIKEAQAILPPLNLPVT